VILGNAFNVPGLTVDTHFGRLVRRWGWTEETDPVKVELVVAGLLPKKEWTIFSHRAIWHGGGSAIPGSQPAVVRARGTLPVLRRGATDPEVAGRLVKTPEAVAESA